MALQQLLLQGLQQIVRSRQRVYPQTGHLIDVAYVFNSIIIMHVTQVIRMSYNGQFGVAHRLSAMAMALTYIWYGIAFKQYGGTARVLFS